MFIEKLYPKEGISIRFTHEEYLKLQKIFAETSLGNNKGDDCK